MNRQDFSALIEAAAEQWSGELLFRRGEHVEGLVVMIDGRVAWAVCSARHEDLGTFLWRLGRISREQLHDVRCQYREEQGARRLGAILEQAGLIRREVLRRCLLLHTRMALTSLSRMRGLGWERQPSNLKLEEEVTFEVEELLPELSNAGAADIDIDWEMIVEAGQWAEWNRHNRSLRSLTEVPEYVGAAVLAPAGGVLFAHIPSEKIDAVHFGVSVSSLAEAASQMLNTYDLGPMQTLTLECDSGSLLAQWINSPSRHLLVALFRSTGQLGLARFKLNSTVPAVTEALNGLNAARDLGAPAAGRAEDRSALGVEVRGS